MFIVVTVISILLKPTFSQISIHSQIIGEHFTAIGQEKKTLLRRLKDIGMASEKLYRDSLTFLIFDMDSSMPIYFPTILYDTYLCHMRGKK